VPALQITESLTSGIAGLELSDSYLDRRSVNLSWLIY
jgi:hypothetical protein